MRDDDLGAALGSLIPQRDLVVDFPERVEHAARRRRRGRRITIGTAAATVLVLAGGLGLALGSGPDPGAGRRAASPGPISPVEPGPAAPAATRSAAAGEQAPPPVDTSRPYVVLSPAVVPAGGAEVALFMANPTARTTTFGLAGEVDRWDGRRWKPFRVFVTSRSFWGPAATLQPVGSDLAVRSLGIMAAAHGYGPANRISTSGLPSGWYRITRSGASGILQVSGTAPAPPGLGVASGPYLDVAPTEAEAGAPTTVHARPSLLTSHGPQPYVTGPGTSIGPVRIERLTGNTWSPVATASDVDLADAGGTSAFVVHLPALPAGIHRLSRDLSGGGVASGVFWVLPAL